MFQVTFTGFHTQAQAEAFADWYQGSGEQHAADWIEHTGITSCNTKNIQNVADGVVVELNVFLKGE